MREASPFRINTTHAHRASIYLYETRRIELSSSHEHFIPPFFLSLFFPPAILAAQEVAESAKIRGFGSTSGSRPLLEIRSTRNNWRSTMLGNAVETVVGQSLFDSISLVDRRKKEVCSKELWLFFYFRRFVGEMLEFYSNIRLSLGLLFKCMGFIKEREREKEKEMFREIRRKS